jgi:hypothetical protein
MTVLRRVVYKMKRSENTSLRNTVEKLIKSRFDVFNVDIEGMVKQVGFYPRMNSRSDTKLNREMFKKNRMINGVKAADKSGRVRQVTC